jgi:elongation factor G
VYDGKHHTVDSKEIAFVTAGRKAFRAAILQARPVVLEPVVDIEIQAPASTMGDITGDLSARRGLVSGTEAGALDTVVIRGKAPLAELTNYQTRLNAMTAGQGRYSLALSHYDATPPSVQQQLVDAFKVHDDE